MARKEPLPYPRSSLPLSLLLFDDLAGGEGWPEEASQPPATPSPSRARVGAQAGVAPGGIV
ncbi:hypothetical protein CRG98_026934 [Punica granatum]|uniref:Uncharacterized protein n=1 Tax=Punica granatum TaxID=22663 RepID=A0A2I0J8U5_PUNGR|nr:hypothetical protein CRG98_026934 [Punica granatum]